jgi:hypothetical protein
MSPLQIILVETAMPHLQTILGTLNTAFSRENLPKLAESREAFREGQTLGAGIVVHPKTALHSDWVKYLHDIPGSIQEAIRSIIHHALSTSPPTQVTFAWAPGYDYELSVWQAPDTRTSRGGITVLIKSRYPNDKHPLKDEPPFGT